MPQKEWKATVAGREVKVVNTWTGGTRLYINGDCRDRNSGMFAPVWTDWMSARLIEGDPSSDLLEVRVVAIFGVKAQIVVNGKVVSGDST